MQKNMQFPAIKWIKSELQLSIQQARALLDGFQADFKYDALENFETIIQTLSYNLEVANDEVGSILCKELSQVAKHIRLERSAEPSARSVVDLVEGLVLLNEHIENISHGYNVDSRRIGVIIDVFRKRQGRQNIQKSLLYVLDISSVRITTDTDEDNQSICVQARDVRPEFQRCLVAWFQDADRSSSIQRLINHTLAIHDIANIELVKLYFLASSLVLTGVKDGVLVDDRDIKMLFNKMDKQLGLLASLGEKKMATGLQLGLVRQTLYFVSKMPSEDERVASLQSGLGLKTNLGESESIHAIEGLVSIATAVREEFKTIRHWLEDIVDHDRPAAEEIDSFIHAAEGWAETLSVVGEQVLSAVIADFVRRLAFCVYGTSGSEDSQLLALAEDWLKIDEELAAIQSRGEVGSDNANDVSDESGAQEEDIPLNVTTAKATLSELVAIKEIVTEDLDQDEQIDVRWPEINQLLNNVQAACYFIELDKPAQFITNCRSFISAVMASSDYRVDEKEVSCLADVVSSVEYILEDIVNNTSVANAALSLAQSAGEFLVSRVEAIQHHAVADSSDSELQALDIPAYNVDAEQEFTNDDDAEILEIFTEEASEIGVELLADITRWKADVNDEETLKDVRRAFHTLKGSGRLAKVEFISETAWPIENMLNEVLEGELGIHEEMVTLVESFADSLPSWVEKINAERPSLEDMSQFILAAEAFGKGELPSVSFEAVNAPLGDLESNAEANTKELISPELCEIFSNETKVHLAAISQYMEEHEGQDEVSVNEALFRALHTIHGSASMSHIDEVEALSGVLCDYIRDLYENNVAVERVGFYSILAGYLSITAQQVQVLHKPLAQSPEYKSLQAIISEKVTALAVHLSQQLSHEVEDNIGPVVEQDEMLGEPLENTPVTVAEERPVVELLPFSSIDRPVNNNDEDDAEMQAVFAEEGIELLEDISELFKEWKENINARSYLGKTLHILHTLKGSSLLVGLNEFGEVVHEVESLLEGYQERNVLLKAPLISTLLKISDRLLVGLQQADKSGQVEHYSSLINLLKDIEVSENTVVNEQEVAQRQAIEQAINKKAVAHSLFEKAMKPAVSTKDQAVKVPNALLDRLIADVGEVNVSQAQLSEKNKEREYQIKELTLTIERLGQQLRALDIETEAQVLFKVDKEAEETDFDPLELDRYTHIQQLSRSLLESITDLEDIRDSLLASDDDIALLMQKESALADTLMGDLLKTRMIDFSRYGPRFERLVRQLSADLGKPTKLLVHGGETEIDRYILNQLQTPIEHVIRNAMAHGVEPAEVRAANGKAKEASIALNLTREGSEIHLIISDDGSGIDLTKVKEKALKLGYLNEGDNLTDQEVMRLILKPGFSTLGEASTLAGRGIGMDIVNDTVRSIGGELIIDSEEGKGASFHLVFPYTMAINMALMVKASEVQYGIPNNFIQSVARIPTELLRRGLTEKQPTLEHLGKDYQLHDLSQLLGYGEGQVLSSDARFMHVLLMGSRQERYAVVVDQLVGNKEVMVKPLGLHLDMISWLSGSTVSDEGDIVLMLDLPALASIGKPQDMDEKLTTVASEIAAPLIMVVDDSITFRKVATKLLTKQGYEVVDARDGIDAVEKLTGIQPDLFLLDVEMPRMDGFELARHIRHTNGISDCPIVMVTSRTGEKHKNHAKDIGVSDYFGKPFDSRLLVASIKGLLESQYAS